MIQASQAHIDGLLDALDSIRESFDGWQGEVAESSVPHEDVLVIDRMSDAGVDLRDLGVRSLYDCDRGFRV